MQAAINIDNAYSDFSDQPFLNDNDFDTWVRENIIPAYEAYKTNPDQGLSSNDIRANLEKAAINRR